MIVVKGVCWPLAFGSGEDLEYLRGQPQIVLSSDFHVLRRSWNDRDGVADVLDELSFVGDS